MDFDSCFLDCCKSCNPTCQKYKTPAAGQGDCKCSSEVTGDQNFWVNSDRGKKLTSNSGKDKEKVEGKDERKKKFWNIQCDCYGSRSKKLECKLTRNSDQGKTNLEIFETSHGLWDHMLPDDCDSKIGGRFPSDDSQHFSSQQMLAQNYLQLKEKVDFLRRLFQDCGHKLSNEGYAEQTQMKASDVPMFGNLWQLLNLNKRMCAAEEGIEKLTEILKDLMKASFRRKDSFFLNEDLSCGSSVKYDEMNIGQRIHFLKNRNDLLTSFVIAFLGSVDEICSRLAVLPKEEPLKQIPMSSKIQYEGKDQTSDLNRDEVLDTLKKLRVPIMDVQEKTLNYKKDDNQNVNRFGKKDDLGGLKYSGNKLEVISEQAEFATNRKVETDKVIGEIKKSACGRNLKGKFSQVSQEGEVCDSTSRLLAQEALLKSSLDQVHFELFSKLDSAEKNFFKDKLNISSLTGNPRKEENKICESESNFGSSSSDVSCAICEAENSENSTAKMMSQISNKQCRLEELKDTKKEEKSFPVGNNLSNLNRAIGKSNEEPSGGNKNHHLRKILHKSSYTVLATSQKPKRSLQSPLDLSNSVQRKKGNEEAVREQRPLTAPTFQRKSFLPSGIVKSPSKTCLKSAIQGEGKKRNSSIGNNVRYRNKVLVSKKSFVRTQP